MRRSTIAVRHLGTLVVVAWLAACTSQSSSPSAGPSASLSASASIGPSPGGPATHDVKAGEAWIVYQWTTGTKDTTFLARPDGKDAHVVVSDVPGLNQFHPDWSPDGSQIVFVAEDFGKKDIWVTEATGENAAVLYESPGKMPFADFPAWSPDGTQIVVATYDREPTVEVSSRSTLTLLDVATGGAEEIAVFEGAHEVVAYPRWAPDGNALVISVGMFNDDDSTWLGEAIAVIQRTEEGWSDPTVITAFEGFGSYPDWHPTDDRIVFATSDLGWFINIVNNSGIDVAERPSRDLFTVRVDGSDLEPITSGGEAADQAGQPSWTPDGRIIFTSDSRGEPGAAFIQADGSGLEMLGVAATHSRLRPTP
jgi:Tol biopolymer transport system component